MIGRKLMLVIHPVSLRLLHRLRTFRHFLMQVLQLLLLLRSKLNGVISCGSKAETEFCDVDASRKFDVN